jgi:hypothetical protein
MAHRSYSGPPKTSSPSFSLLCPWIHGLFPAIEFAVVTSPSLSNFGNPGPPNSRLPQLRRPHRRGEEHRRPQPFNALGLVPSIRFRSNGLDCGYRFAHACPDALACLLAPKSSGAGPTRSVRPPPLSLTPLAPLVSHACVVGVWSPPSDSDRTTRTTDNASRTRALTPLAPLVSRACAPA